MLYTLYSTLHTLQSIFYTLHDTLSTVQWFLPGLRLREDRGDLRNSYASTPNMHVIPWGRTNTVETMVVVLKKFPGQIVVVKWTNVLTLTQDAVLMCEACPSPLAREKPCSHVTQVARMFICTSTLMLLFYVHTWLYMCLYISANVCIYMYRYVYSFMAMLIPFHFYVT